MPLICISIILEQVITNYLFKISRSDLCLYTSLILSLYNAYFKKATFEQNLKVLGRSEILEKFV